MAGQRGGKGEVGPKSPTVVGEEEEGQRGEEEEGRLG